MANYNGFVNNGFARGSRLAVDGKTDQGEVISSQGSETSCSTSCGSSPNNNVQQTVVRGGIGASTKLENPFQNSMYVKEGRIMSLQLPTGKKGFIGDIGFAFGGTEYDEKVDRSDWTATPILVESVARGSIAEKAGLEPGDEIIKINAVTVTNAARSLPVSLIRNSDKKMRLLVRKGKGANRTENRILSGEQIQEFYDAFSLYDRNNKNKVLVKDVPHVCRLLGYNETALALDDAISAARKKTGEPDTNKMKWNTFIEVMKEIMKHQDIEKDAMTAYAVFDNGRRGHFSIRKLRDAFVMSTKASPLEMAEIFRAADPDLDGKVYEKEFLRLLHPMVEMY